MRPDLRYAIAIGQLGSGRAWFFWWLLCRNYWDQARYGWDKQLSLPF